MNNPVDEFNAYRSMMNEKLLANDNLIIKRFFNLDTNTYSNGALNTRTKEMLGLVASIVLRCDDCIKYHLEKCRNENINKAEILDIFSIALIVAGSITIPHIRRAYEYWEILEKK